MARDWLRLEFTFTHSEDVARYGSDPYLYDERELVSMPALDLAAIEAETGMTIKDMINGLRESVTLADRAAVWWAMTRVREMPPLSEFNVRTMLIEWEKAPADESGKEAPAPPDWEPLTSEPSTVVSLPTLPRAE